MVRTFFSGSPSRACTRSGRVSSLWVLLLGACGLIAVLVVMLRQGPPESESGKQRLVVYCAAGMREPVEEIARRYEQTYGVVIELQYAGSNTLLNQLQVNKFSDADLFLAADDFYTDKAVHDGIADETLPIAYQRPVIAVRKDSPKQIDSLEDLLQPGISVAVADPDQAAVGKSVRSLLEKIEVNGTNRWKQLEARVMADGVFKPTVGMFATPSKAGRSPGAWCGTRRLRPQNTAKT
ncbi:MAG: substrate-binding domain-containing protein [Planctomycetaceae bacterium]